MRNRIDVIRDLASLEIQERYIVNGTRDEYLLPGDLVGDAMTLVELVAAGKVGRSLSTHQHALLEKLRIALLVVEPVVSGGMSNENLVANDPRWAAVRKAAQRFMQTLDDGGAASGTRCK